MNLGVQCNVDVPGTEQYKHDSFFDINATSRIAGMVATFPNLGGAMQFIDAETGVRHPPTRTTGDRDFGFACKIGNKT